MMSSEDHVFDWPDRFQRMADTFKAFQSQKLHSDVILYADEQSFDLHKLVLIASSDYFEKVLREIPSPLCVIILKDMPASILKLLIEFMYSGSVRVKPKQREEFISNAISLKLKGFEKILEQKKSPAQDLNVFSRIQALSNMTSNPGMHPGIPMTPTTLGNYGMPDARSNYFSNLAALAVAHDSRSHALLSGCAAPDFDSLNGISKRRKVDHTMMRPVSAGTDTRVSSSPEDLFTKLQMRAHMTTPETQSEPHDMSLSCRSGNTSSPTVSIEKVPSSPRSEMPATNGQGNNHQDDVKPIPALIPHRPAEGSAPSERRSPMSSRRKSSPPIRILHPSSAEKEIKEMQEKASAPNSSPDSKLLIDSGTPMKRPDSPDHRQDASSSDNRYSEEEASDQNDHSTESQTENLAGPSTSRPRSQAQEGILGWPMRNGSSNNGDIYNLDADKLKILAQGLALGANPTLEGLFPSVPFSSFLQQSHPNPLYGSMNSDDTDNRSRNSTRKKPTSKPYKCEKCSRSYASAGNLTRHKSYECGVEPKFGCPVCSRSFQHNHSAKLHVSTNHPNELRDLLLQKHLQTEKIMGISQDKSGDPTTIEKVLAIAEKARNNEKKRNRQASEME